MARWRSAAEETETLFDRYIPVNQAYSAKVSPFSVTQGVSYSFSTVPDLRMKQQRPLYLRMNLSEVRCRDSFLR